MPRPPWFHARRWFRQAGGDTGEDLAEQRLRSLEARLERLEAALAELTEGSAEARAELLALANSLRVYRADVEALEARARGGPED